MSRLCLKLNRTPAPSYDLNSPAWQRLLLPAAPCTLSASLYYGHPCMLPLYSPVPLSCSFLTQGLCTALGLPGRPPPELPALASCYAGQLLSDAVLTTPPSWPSTLHPQLQSHYWTTRSLVIICCFALSCYICSLLDSPIRKVVIVSILFSPELK